MVGVFMPVTLVQSQAFGPSAQYLVIDLSGGPDVSKYPVQYTNEQPDVDFDTCRTKELWLRLIPAGTFMMGSPASEIGRHREREELHQVTLTQPFYVGVFEVTQRQYELVMGALPPGNDKYKGATRPVGVSWDTLRGTSAGAQWPADNGVDASSFFGVLRAKTGVLADLPTAAQWEYACRAGTASALNNGKDTTHDQQCLNVAELGRCRYNQNDSKGGYTEGTAKVGSYPPNAWGLYDMHGNVYEWCLDWYRARLGTDPVTDPRGPESGSTRSASGGGFNCISQRCRSAYRHDHLKTNQSAAQNVIHGFRIVVLPGAAQAAAVPARPATPPPPSPVAPSGVFRTPEDKDTGAEKPKGSTIRVTFRIDAARSTLQETGGNSPRARSGDEIIFSTVSGGGSREPDSIWVIERAEMTEGPIRQVRTDRGYSRLPPLVTDGNFVLVYYTVENTTQHADFHSAMPVLVDSRDRRFLPVGEASNDRMASYVPDGRLWFARDKIAPGFTKSFSVIFEIPPNSTPKHIEIYPSDITRGFTDAVRQGRARGKAVDLSAAFR